MKERCLLYIGLLCCLLLSVDAAAQNKESRAAAKRQLNRPVVEQPDTLQADTLHLAQKDTLLNFKPMAVTDTLAMERKFVPNPSRATWLALVFPGAGQIYNRKYWKLPIFYGGFVGCAYALNWNDGMYKDYASAYKDAVNGNWTSTNITDLLPAGYLSRVSTTQITSLLKKRKDYYRRYRDISVFCFIGVYILSVIDAYVDAELSNFDISPDISMRVEPAIISTRQEAGGLRNNALGVQCGFSF